MPEPASTNGSARALQEEFQTVPVPLEALIHSLDIETASDHIRIAAITELLAFDYKVSSDQIIALVDGLEHGSEYIESLSTLNRLVVCGVRKDRHHEVAESVWEVAREHIRSKGESLIDFNSRSIEALPQNAYLNRASRKIETGQGISFEELGATFGELMAWRYEFDLAQLTAVIDKFVEAHPYAIDSILSLQQYSLEGARSCVADNDIVLQWLDVMQHLQGHHTDFNEALGSDLRAALHQITREEPEGSQ